MVAGLQAAQPERNIMRNVDELHQPKNVGSVSIELATQPYRIALRCNDRSPIALLRSGGLGLTVSW